MRYPNLTGTCVSDTGGDGLDEDLERIGSGQEMDDLATVLHRPDSFLPEKCKCLNI